jgi:hypothetical protein
MNRPGNLGNTTYWFGDFGQEWAHPGKQIGGTWIYPTIQPRPGQKCMGGGVMLAPSERAVPAGVKEALNKIKTDPRLRSFKMYAEPLESIINQLEKGWSPGISGVSNWKCTAKGQVPWLQQRAELYRNLVNKELQNIKKREEDARRRAAEEARRRAEEAKRRAAEEAKRKAEEAKRRAAEEAKRRAAEAAARAKAAALAKAKADCVKKPGCTWDGSKCTCKPIVKPKPKPIPKVVPKKPPPPPALKRRCPHYTKASAYPPNWQDPAAAERYKKKYPDVRKWVNAWKGRRGGRGVTALWHYRCYGKREGRTWAGYDIPGYLR